MNAETNFSALDRQFGNFLERLAGESPEIRLAAMCASRARAEGNICVSLGEIAEMEGAPGVASLRKKLRGSGVVGAPGAFTPLILDGRDRLYLRRYWEYEQQLAAGDRQSDVRFLFKRQKGKRPAGSGGEESGLE